MFNVIRMSKAGMWFKEKHVEGGWRRSIRIEDTVTAVVFDAVAGLRGETFAKFLYKAVEDDKMDFDWLGRDDFEDEPWPSYFLGGDRIEPDRVFISHSKKSVVIIEAKLDDVQTEKQLKKEVEAVYQHHPSYSICILALGGENAIRLCKHLKSKMPRKATLSATSWERLLDASEELLDLDITNAERRILDYLRNALDWFGFRRFGGFRFPIDKKWPCLSVKDDFAQFSLIDAEARGVNLGPWLSDLPHFGPLHWPMEDWTLT